MSRLHRRDNLFGDCQQEMQGVKLQKWCWQVGEMVLTKTQEVKMNVWVRDNAELVEDRTDQKHQVSNGHAQVSFCTFLLHTRTMHPHTHP